MVEEEKKFSPHGDEYTEDMLPPEPKKWPTAEELKAARNQEPFPRVKGGIRFEPNFRLLIGPKGGIRRKGPKIK